MCLSPYLPYPHTLSRARPENLWWFGLAQLVSESIEVVAGTRRVDVYRSLFTVV
jgi:hypothetical protein